MYPQYDPYDGSEELSYENEWVGEQEQIIEGADCFSPFAFLNPTENLVVLKLTEQEWTEMLSSVWWGAMFAYPEKYLQIVTNLLKGIHCPPVLEEQDCYEYPTYAGFFRYSPMNPYIQPDEIPDGYETQPFLVNGENGNNIPNYEHFDVIIPSSAITLDVNWFETIAGQLPTIEVMVQGEGKAFIKMLTLAGGGLAVITVDNPPDLVDIISGIVTSADNIIDLNQDLVSLPPETAQELIFPLDLVGSGLHTIYIVFLPILDDSLIPFRFGGGFRGVQLCDFVETPEMGITSLRFENCNLEQQVNGEWTIVSGWENWLDCIPVSPGGGGVGSSLKVDIRRMALTGANLTTVSTTFVDLTGNSFNYVLSKPNCLILWDGVLLNNSLAAGETIIRLLVNGNQGLEAQDFVMRGTTFQEQPIAERFEGLTLGQIAIKLQWRVSSGTGSYSTTVNGRVVIIEYENASDLYVEDVRIQGRELQKKIGGVWITVTDSLAAILNQIEATANNALVVANGAVSVNNTQQNQINSAISVNNSQNTRLTNLESFQADAELELAQHTLTLANHEARIDALEAGVDGIPSWIQEYDFTVDSHGWVGATWTAGQGFVFSTDLNLILPGKTVSDSRIRFVEVRTRRFGGASPLNSSALFGGGSDFSNIKTTSPNLLNFNWIKVPNLDFEYVPSLYLETLGSNARLEYMRIVGVGTFNPFS